MQKFYLTVPPPSIDFILWSNDLKGKGPGGGLYKAGMYWMVCGNLGCRYKNVIVHKKS
jgi:uncharacterized iron-regulated protein